MKEGITMYNKSNANVISAISYLTWVGFIVALIMRDKTDSFTTFHLNQALVLNILSIVGGAVAIIPLVGGIASTIVSAAVFVLWCIGIYRAFVWSTEPLPVIGDIHLIG